MRQKRPLLLLALMAITFTAGMWWLYQLRISGGDVFPVYSSLRADPLGTRCFFEALASLPGLRAERSLVQLEKLEAQPPRTIILAGMRRHAWESVPTTVSNALDATVRAGSRVVVIFAAEQEPLYDESDDAPEKQKVEKKKTEKTENPRPPKKGQHADRLAPPDEQSEANLTDWTRLWGAKTKRRQIFDRMEGAKAVEVPEGFPRKISWRSDLYFEPTQGSNWKVLYSRGSVPVMIEMELGKGSVVYASDGYFVSNEALQKNRDSTLLAWLIGNHRWVIFDESHLGLEEEHGVAGLARHYGLAGSFLVFVVLALLFIWRRAALFVPPPIEDHELQLSYNQTAGLEMLLRRVLPISRLIPTCADEWTKTARPSEVVKLNAVLREQPSSTQPAVQYNAAVKAFRRR